MKYDNILQTIGNTPHIRINRLFRDDIEVWMKTESFNPCNSIKDRIARAMIEDAEEKGLINKDTVIINRPPVIPVSAWHWSLQSKVIV